MADSKFVPSDVRDDLVKLEKALKLLAIGYEMFLNQTVRWPPHERKAIVDAIVRYYTKNPPRQTADRFRFNNLHNKYRTNMERWKRRLRQLEESGNSAPGTRLDHARQSREIEDADAPYTLMSVRVREESQDADQLRDLYLAYRQARRARGKAVSKLGYAAFASKMRGHVEKARTRSGREAVELRVDTLGGNVRIAVRSLDENDSEAGGDAGTG